MRRLYPFAPLFGLFAASLAQAAPAPPSPGDGLAPAPADAAGAPGSDRLTLDRDRAERLTIPVEINGQGPFPFVVDTGADRTVISKELADRLGLPAGPHVAVQNSGGVDVVDTAIVSSLKVGARLIAHIEAPVLTAQNIGGLGMLGIDSLKDQHVVLDFRNKELRAAPSRTELATPDTIVVRGRSRFGQLVLVDATIRRQQVFVILDSGAQNSIGNPALQRLLAQSAPGDPKVDVVSVTGRTTPGRFHDVAEAKIGGLTIRNMPLAFADLATFKTFGLVDQPALLLGMDVLGLCERVTVDFAKREASFTLY